MARKRKDNRWNDIDGGKAFTVPYTLLRHPNFYRLSAYGHKLLMDLARQYTGFNNGYLCSSWALMSEAGWNSENTVRKAMRELEHYRLIERTRQGGRNRANLHAFTWRRIDAKANDFLDVSQTMKPSDSWKEERPEFERTAGTRKARAIESKALKAAA